jgi:hypothetical protein
MDLLLWLIRNPLSNQRAGAPIPMSAGLRDRAQQIYRAARFRQYFRAVPRFSPAHRRSAANSNRVSFG